MIANIYITVIYSRSTWPEPTASADMHASSDKWVQLENASTFDSQNKYLQISTVLASHLLNLVASPQASSLELLKALGIPFGSLFASM